ncbi:MAG: hypothetical protein WC841_04740 [Candidatus Shapirobacteria bacterium]|jgi:hypothetical protein
MSLVKKYWAQLLLCLILFPLLAANFSPDTWLSGWDNLHPELNLPANIKRSVFSVWQEYQGLGLLAGMAHAADLPRQLILLILSPIIPTHLLRYLFHFSMIIAGSFGTFYLTAFILKPQKSSLPSLLSSLFYLLNFGSVQYLNLPFEPYTTFWGMLPWLLLSLLIVLDHPSRRHWFIFIAVNILSIPMSYVQTIFLVYFISLSLVFLFHFLSTPSHHRFKALKIYSSIALTIFFLNSFWLLPNIFFTLTNISVTQNAMMNLKVTDQFIEQNQHRGHITDFLLLQGQYYDIKDYLSGVPKPLLEVWHTHFSSFIIRLASIILTFTSLLGLFSKNKYKKIFLGILLFSCVGLLSDTPIFKQVNLFFRSIPALNQIFRNSFTKLITPAVLSLSVSFGLAINFLIHRFRQIGHTTTLLIFPLLIAVSWPSFKGNFIHPRMRAKIPPSYLELFQYFKDIEPSKRIINLPQYNYWGWENYKWGLTGSGFLWYGIDQPILDRAFDVWSSESENYYWQLHHALITRDSNLFDNILLKYNISYIIFDDTISFPDAANTGRVLRENKELIENSKLISLKKSFGDINLYKVNQSQLLPQNVGIFKNLSNIQNPERFSNFDPGFQSFGPYKTDYSKPFQAQFPFGSLFTGRPENYPFRFTEDQNTVYLNNPPYSVQFTPQWLDCTGFTSVVTAVNTETSEYYSCGNLETKNAYLLKIKTTNISGRPFNITVFSSQDNKIYIDSKINPNLSVNYFFLPPIYEFDNGIGINFRSLSLSDTASVNQVESAQISVVPWNYLITPTSNPSVISRPTVSIPKVHHPNQSFYKISLDKPRSDSTLFLAQSFHPGWLAFYFKCTGKPVCLPYPIFLPHLLINNWANGWQLQVTDYRLPVTIYVFFWPQLLQFLGFGLFLIPILRLIKRNF